MYRWSPLQKKLMPTLAEARRAIKQAEADNETRNVRPLMACLQRLMLADPRLGGHILSRRSAVTAFPYVMTPQDGAPGEAEAQAARAARRLDPVIRKVMHYQLRTALYGAMVMRLNIEYDEQLDAQVMSVDRVYDPDEVERPTTREDDVRLLSQEGPRLQRRPVPNDNTHLVAVDENPWIGGVLREILFDEILRHQTVTEWANFTRKLKGIIQAAMEGGVPPEGDPDRDVAEKALRTMVEENYALTGDRTQFMYNKLVDAAGGQSFKAFKADRDTDIAIAILGQSGTSDLPDHGGSRAALEVLNLVRRDIHHSDVQRTEHIINEQLLLNDYRLNVDRTARRVPYAFSVQLPTEESTESAARGISDALDAGLPLVASEVYDRLGFSVPEGVPEVVRADDLRSPTTDL